MQPTFLLSILLAHVMAVVSDNTGCNFPSVIQTTPWFDHYDLPARNKWVVQYSNAKMTVSFNFEEGGEIQENADTPLDCKDSVHDRSTHTFLLNRGNDWYCGQLTVAEGNLAIFKRMTNLPIGRGLVPMARLCNVGGVMNHAPSQFQVRYSGAAFPSFGSRCPFRPGSYAVQMEGGRSCSTTARVEGTGNSVISLGPCKTVSGAPGTSPHSPVNVFGGTLKCFGELPSGTLRRGSTTVSSDKPDNLLLLATAHTKTPSFYCARYSLADDGTVRMSVYIQSTVKPLCPMGVTSRTTTSGHVALIMTPTNVSPAHQTTTQPFSRQTGSAPNDPIGLCPFPNNFQGNQRWWRGYVGPASSDYKYDVFGSSFIKEYRQSIKNTPTKIYRCYSSGFDGNKELFLLEVTGRNKFECREYLSMGAVLILRSLELNQNDNVNLDRCKEGLRQGRKVEILPQFSASWQVDTMKCPLPETTYQTTIYEQSGPSAPALCQGDITSLTTVSGSVIRVHSCQTSNTYGKPFFSEFHCMATWPAIMMKGAYSSILNNPNYQYLVLYKKPENGRPHFYVAKYVERNNGIVDLSLAVERADRVMASLTSSPDTVDNMHQRFLLTPTKNILEPKQECKDLRCINGLCGVNSGLWQCNCYTGYTGISCEQALQKGTCFEKPCKNGGSCESKSGGYFNCICKPGYTGVYCQSQILCYPNPCTFGTCRQNDHGYVCDCQSGFSGTQCAQSVTAEDEEDRTILIILVTLLAVFVIAVVIVTVIICQRKRRNDRKSIPVNPDGDLPNQTYASMSAWYPDYKNQLAASEEKELP